MAETKKTPDLRIAVISDTHVGFLGHINPNYYGLGQKPLGDQSKWLEYALRYFKNRGIDAFVCPGDMANACAYKGIFDGQTSADRAVVEIEEFGAIFKKVFEGTDTKLVTIYGNHDNLCQNREPLNGGNYSPWEHAFDTPYTHINKVDVNGYTFIGANWGYEQEAAEYIKEAAKNNSDKPFFYIQHDMICGTTYDSYGKVQSSINIADIRDYDNLIAFFGHTHAPITDERAIWQSAKEGDPKFTAISCSTLNYGDSTGDLLRGENLMTKHSLYITVAGKEVNVERISFYTPEMLALARGEKTEQNFAECTRSCGADWNFEIGGEKVLDFDKRAEDKTAPEFPEGATAGLARSDNFVQIFFPAAIPLDRDDDLIHSYCVDVFKAEGEKYVTTEQIVTEFHVDHSSDYLSPYYQIPVPDLNPDTKYIFKVYARDCFGKRSKKPVIHIGTTLKAKRERLY